MLLGLGARQGRESFLEICCVLVKTPVWFEVSATPVRALCRTRLAHVEQMFRMRRNPIAGYFSLEEEGSIPFYGSG